jgi:hypothetical protein
VDLGDEHWLRYSSWDADLSLNPQYADLADRIPVAKFGALVWHLLPVGHASVNAAIWQNPEGRSLCIGGITFASDIAERIEPNRPKWDVQAWEPLTISPSLLCSCGDHGYIREGRWVRA